MLKPATWPVLSSLFPLLVRFQAPKEWTSVQYDTILIRVEDTFSGSNLMSDSPFFWEVPKAIPNLAATRVQITVHSIERHTNKSAAVITLSSDALVLYVVLTTQAAGRFEENAFVLRPQQKKVSTGGNWIVTKPLH